MAQSEEDHIRSLLDKIQHATPVATAKLPESTVKYPIIPPTYHQVKGFKPPPEPPKVTRDPQEECEESIANDALVKAIKNRAESVKILQILKEEVAREAAFLGYSREGKMGRDAVTASTKRIAALSKVADIELEIKKQGGGNLDFRGEQIQRLFHFWTETLQEVASEVLPPELVDLFFNRLGTAMENWEDRAAEVTKE